MTTALGVCAVLALVSVAGGLWAIAAALDKIATAMRRDVNVTVPTIHVVNERGTTP